MSSIEVIREVIDKFVQMQNEQLEKLAAAFVAEVGSEEASKHELVQKVTENKVRWYFWRRKDVD